MITTQTIRKRGVPRPTETMDRWKLEDAKAKLGEVVRLATSEGPQMVTVRGKEAAVILDPETYRQLVPEAKRQLPLVDFLQGLDFSGIDLERERDCGREVDLIPANPGGIESC